MLRNNPFSHFKRNTDGVAATEFSIVAPILIIIFIGVVSVTLNYKANQDVNLSAQTLSDLITQEERITVEQLNDLATGVKEIAGSGADDIIFTVVSISVDERGKKTINWTWRSGGGDEIDTEAILDGADERFIGATDSIIMTEADLTIDEIFLSKERRFVIAVERRPRFSQRVFLCSEDGDCE